MANHNAKSLPLAHLFATLHFAHLVVVHKFIVCLICFSSLSFHLFSLTFSTIALSNVFFSFGLLSIHQTSQHESRSNPLMVHCPSFVLQVDEARLVDCTCSRHFWSSLRRYGFILVVVYYS